MIDVVAAVVTRGGRLLVCQRPTHKHHGGMWEFPGGKVEPGESLAGAIQREMTEELDLRVRRVGEVLHEERDAVRGVRLLFLPVEIDGEPRCLEHQALAWCTREELEGYALAPMDRAFVAAQGRR